MSSGPPGEGLTREQSSAEWLLLRGHRVLITALVLAIIATVTFLLIEFDVLEAGPSSSMPTLLSGIVAGQLTLLTVTLSINQLILSRMFASPPEIRERLQGTVDFRGRVGDVVGEGTPPVNPQPFLETIARALSARAEELAEIGRVTGSERQETIEECAASLQRYAEMIQDLVDDERMETLHVVSLLPHEAYVRNAVTVEALQADGNFLPERTVELLGDVSTLLAATTIARQHFKTIAIQQQLARLSRYIVYTGIPSISAAAVLALAYTSTGGLKVSEPFVRPVVALGVAAFMSPGVLLSAYVLPLALVAERTVATGPFLATD